MTQAATIHPASPAPAAQAPAKSDFEKLMERDYVTPRMADNAAEMREFDQRMRKARVYAESDVVPAHYRGKANNCYIAIEIAERLKVSELMVMQNTYVVQGKLGFQAQFAIAVMNSSGLFEGPLEFEIECDDPDDPLDPSYRMRAVATRKGKSRAIKGPWVTWDMVKAEGWFGKNGSKWPTIPDMMFRYRTAAFFGRTVCPELLMGFQTVEELEDTYGPGEGDPLPKRNVEAKRKSLADMTIPPDGVAAPANASSSTPPEGSAAEAGPSSETTTGTTGEAREKPEGAVDAQAASTPPKGSGRPKSKKIENCKDCGAPVSPGSPCSNCAMQKPRDHQPSKGVEQAEASPEFVADAFASETPLDAIRKWMMDQSSGVRDAAFKMAGITSMADAAEKDVRNAAYNAKFYVLTNPKK